MASNEPSMSPVRSTYEQFIEALRWQNIRCMLVKYGYQNDSDSVSLLYKWPAKPWERWFSPLYISVHLKNPLTEFHKTWNSELVLQSRSRPTTSNFFYLTTWVVWPVSYNKFILYNFYWLFERLHWFMCRHQNCSVGIVWAKDKNFGVRIFSFNIWKWPKTCNINATTFYHFYW